MSQAHKFTKQYILPSKVAPSKIYDYIKKIEVDGYPRVRAYAEAIDSSIYEMPPSKIKRRLDYIRDKYPGYSEIKESVLAEQRDWVLRRSSRIQDKSIELLANLLDKANEMATNPDTDIKEFTASVQMLKTIMPALTANNNNGTNDKAERKRRAREFIN